MLSKWNQLWTICIGLVGAAAAIVVYYATIQHIDADNFERFKRAVDDHALSIKKDLHDTFHMVYDVSRLFNSVPHVTAQVFYGIINNNDFEEHPSFYNVGWAPRVAYNKKTEFELAASKEGILQDFYIFERSSGKDVAVAARDEYFPVYYRKQEKNTAKRIIGFDIASDPIRRKALEKARDTGQMAASDPIRLITDPSANVQAIQVYMPVYYGLPETVDFRRTNLMGFTFGTFRIKNIFEESFRANSDSNKSTLFDIEMLGLQEGEGLLYRYTPPGVVKLSKLNYVKTIDVAGRTIQIKAVPALDYFAQRRGLQPALYAAGTFIIVCLFCGFVASVKTYNAQLKAAVEKQTIDLMESEKKYRQLVELSNEGVWAIDAKGNTTFVNQALADMHGYMVEEMLGVSFLDFMDDKSKSAAKHAVFEIQPRGEAVQLEAVQLEAVHLHKNGSKVHVLLSLVPIIDELGNHVSSFAVISDITKRKILEKWLQESEHKYRQLVEMSQEGIWATDKDYKTTFVNPAMADMLGYTLEEMLGVVFLDLLDDESRLKAKSSLKYQLQSGKEDPLEVVFQHKSGKAVSMSVSSVSIIDDSGGYAGSVAVLSDITKRKELDAQLRKSLAEKDVLLKEIHHRVKNNLQIIAGMLGMQMQYVSDQNYYNMFEDCQRRIQSIALIHERLYRSEGFTNIDMRDYVAQLAEAYSMSLVNKDAVSIKIDIDHISVGIDIAIPCGLIINELLINAMKHAFPNGNASCTANGTCEVRIAIHSLDNNIEMVVPTEKLSMTELPGWLPPYSSNLELSVADNGTGFPEGEDFRNCKGLGMQIVLILVRQLGGTIELDGSQGTKFTIIFNNISNEQPIPV